MCIKYSPSLLIFIKNGGVILHFYNKTWSFRCRLKSNCSSVSQFYFFFTDSTRADVVNRLKLDIIVINRFDPPIDIYQNIDCHGEIDRNRSHRINSLSIINHKSIKIDNNQQYSITNNNLEVNILMMMMLSGKQLQQLLASYSRRSLHDVSLVSWFVLIDLYMSTQSCAIDCILRFFPSNLGYTGIQFNSVYMYMLWFKLV